MHIPAYVIYCLEAWPHVSKPVFRIINVCIIPAYVIYCLEAWPHVSEAVFCIINVCIYYAYVIYCLETWPHVSEPVFCFINVCTYMHMWYIAWRHDPMYLSQCFVLLMYAHICICDILLGDMTPCIWASVSIFNVCTYMHMWYIAWRHDPMYLRMCFVLLMYAHTCMCDILLGGMTPCIWGSVSFY